MMPANPRGDSILGRTLAHFTVLEKLGEGGMGEVYLAEDRKLGRKVALKRLPDVLADDSVALERFRREARTLAALNHPGIVTIYSVDEADGVSFLTMELLEGRTLEQLVPEGGLELPRFFELAVPIAGAVAAAHEKGVTHRDLKPASVMVTDDGRVKVLDFGLAKLREEGAGDEATRGLTTDGLVLGTLPYMAPEQVQGKPADERSDIFSLGAMLYEMASGRRPFGGESSADLVSSILRDRPAALAETRTELPRHLSRIVGRCLEKAPRRRFQTALDLHNELEGLRREVESGEYVSGAITATAPSPSPPRAGRWKLVAAVAATAVAAIGLWLLLGRARPAAPPVESPSEPMLLRRITASGRADDAVISPDGRLVAHVVLEDGQQSLWLRQVATDSDIQIAAPAEVDYDGLAFSPDGDYLYFVRKDQPMNDIGALFVMPVLGGDARKLIDDVDGGLAVSPDGSRIAFGRGFDNHNIHAIFVAALDGGEERELLRRTQPAELSDQTIAWSPDGEVLAVAFRHRSPRIESWIVIVPVDGGEPRQLGEQTWAGVAESGLSWLPDGSALIASARAHGDPVRSIWRIGYPHGEARRLTHGLTAYLDVSVAAQGRRLVTVEFRRTSNLWVAEADDLTALRPLTSDSSSFNGLVGPSWTGDGRLIYTSDLGGGLDLWLLEAASGERRRLTTGEGYELAPSVCGDDRSVLYTAETGGINVWRVGLDGGDPLQLTFGSADGDASCSPDGSWAAFSSRAGGRPVIYRLGFDGERRELPPGRFPQVSPDGGKIAFGGAMSDGEWGVAVLDLATGETAELPVRPIFWRWSPEGGGLDYLRSRGDQDIYRIALDSDEPEKLTDFTNGITFAFAWSRDGRRLALSRGSITRDVVLIENAERAAAEPAVTSPRTSLGEAAANPGTLLAIEPGGRLGTPTEDQEVMR